MKRFDRIPQTDGKGRLRAVLKSPQGSRHKLKYDPADGGFSISSTFPAGMSMPFDFGFFPRTKAADGDPLDVLVLLDGPAHPGVTVPVRLLGVIEAEQTDRGSKEAVPQRPPDRGRGRLHGTRRSPQAVGPGRDPADADRSVLRNLRSTVGQVFSPGWSARAARRSKTARTGDRSEIVGAPGRIRTRDLMVRSHPLYPLSYRRSAVSNSRLASEPQPAR